MYADTNFKTKKSFREAVISGKEVRIFQTNDFFGNPKASPDYTGSATVEGPHYPEPHKWYATVDVVDGIVAKVR